jgi:hypothetical protein
MEDVAPVTTVRVTAYEPSTMKVSSVRDMNATRYGQGCLPSMEDRLACVEDSGATLDKLAKERQARFGSLDASWLVKRCFGVWKDSIVLTAGSRPVVATTPQRVIASTPQRVIAATPQRKMDVVERLQSSLLQREKMITDFQSRLRDLEQRLQDADYQRDHAKHHWEDRWRQSEEDNEHLRRQLHRHNEQHTNQINGLRESHAQEARDFEMRLEKAAQMHARLLEEHSLHLRRLQGDHEEVTEQLTEQSRMALHGRAMSAALALMKGKNGSLLHATWACWIQFCEYASVSRHAEEKCGSFQCT